MASISSSGSSGSETLQQQPLKTGYLFKQGGAYRSWKKRYFVLHDSKLNYYVKEGDKSPKGSIDLATGRGVRSKEQCQSVEEWPKDAKDDTTFGLAIESRTYFIFGKEPQDVQEWIELLQQRIEKIGNPNHSYENDPEGKPEGLPSKLVKKGSKLATRLTKSAIRVASSSGLVDSDTVEVVDGVADAVENQAEAGRDATIADRFKMAAGDSAGMVSDNVDNPYVSTAAGVVQDQIEADEDASLQQRVLMSTGTVLEGAADIVGEENEIAGGVMGVAAGVVGDQAEADEEMSVKQRLILAGGSAVGGAGEMVGDMTDIQLAADAIQVTGDVIKDQAEADEDTSMEDRAKMGVGSAAGSAAELDSMRYNYAGQRACHEIQSVAS